VALRKFHQRILLLKELLRKQLHQRKQVWKSKKVKKKDLMTISDFIKLNLLIMETNETSNPPSDSHPPLDREPTALVRPRKIPVIKRKVIRDPNKPPIQEPIIKLEDVKKIVEREVQLSPRGIVSLQSLKAVKDSIRMDTDEMHTEFSITDLPLLLKKESRYE